MQKILSWYVYPIYCLLSSTNCTHTHKLTHTCSTINQPHATSSLLTYEAFTPPIPINLDCLRYTKLSYQRKIVRQIVPSPFPLMGLLIYGLAFQCHLARVGTLLESNTLRGMFELDADELPNIWVSAEPPQPEVPERPGWTRPGWHNTLIDRN